MPIIKINRNQSRGISELDTVKKREEIEFVNGSKIVLLETDEKFKGINFNAFPFLEYPSEWIKSNYKKLGQKRNLKKRRKKMPYKPKPKPSK